MNMKNMVVLSSTILVIMLLSIQPGTAADKVIEHSAKDKQYTYKDTITLTADNSSWKLQINYDNVKGDFLFYITISVDSNGSVIQSTNYTKISVHTSGKADYISDNDSKIYLMQAGSGVYYTYRGNYGCADCTNYITWDFMLNTTESVTFDVLYQGTNLQYITGGETSTTAPFYFGFSSLVLITLMANMLRKRRSVIV